MKSPFLPAHWTVRRVVRNGLLTGDPAFHAVAMEQVRADALARGAFPRMSAADAALFERLLAYSAFGALLIRQLPVPCMHGYCFYSLYRRRHFPSLLYCSQRNTK
jgi:hypothetical protein